MRVTAPADKRFRRAHLKPSRKRGTLTGWRLMAVFFVVVSALTLYAGHRAVAAISGLDVFRVRTINVRGNHRLSKGEVLAMLHGLQGLSILEADLEEWRRAVMSSPWVADASLRRTLPSSVELTILERAPLGIGRISGGLYLVDDRGIVIDEYGPTYGDLDLPIIDGLSAAPGEEAANVHRAMLARRLLDAVRAARHTAGQISQIDVSDSRNAVVLLEGDPTQLRLGDERFAEHLQSYRELAPALREQVPAIDYVDLRFDARVYVRPAERRVVPGAAKPNQKRGQGTQTG